MSVEEEPGIRKPTSDALRDIYRSEKSENEGCKRVRFLKEGKPGGMTDYNPGGGA